MLKRIIAIILVLMILITFVSCDKASDDNAMIQIWSYDFENAEAYSKALASVLSNAKFYCDKNGIPLEIVMYNEKNMSYDDYVLKRNVAVSNGNAIIIEDAKYINDIAKQHADYSKLDNYDKLLDVYKDRFCIPLGIGHGVLYKYNDAINYYDINTDNPIITYDEYLGIKQQMKEKGAKFKLNYLEFEETVNYFLIKNKIKYINQENDILKESYKFEESLKNTIIELCDDFIAYNSMKLDAGSLKDKEINSNSYNKNDYTIYDENSGLILCDYPGSELITYYGNYVNSLILNRTLVIDPNVFVSPCFYMHKKITNTKIYDLANYIVNENSYFYVAGNGPYYAPVFNDEKTRRKFEVDENWQYQGIYKSKAEQGSDVDKRIYALYDEVYNMLIRSEEKSNLLANYYFTNREYSDKIYNFVADMIIELSNKNYDYKNEEINKLIDNKIDEFITNFNIHYN